MQKALKLTALAVALFVLGYALFGQEVIIEGTESGNKYPINGSQFLNYTAADQLHLGEKDKVYIVDKAPKPSAPKPSTINSTPDNASYGQPDSQASYTEIALPTIADDATDATKHSEANEKNSDSTKTPQAPAPPPPADDCAT